MIKPGKLTRLVHNQILRLSDYKKEKDDKWRDPLTRRLVKKETAITRVAKVAGYKSFEDYKEARKSSTYKYFEDWARKKNLPVLLGSQFSRNYAAWRNEKFERRSYPLRELLSTLDWLTEENHFRYN